MAFNLAVIGDIHLNVNSPSPQHACLEWAVKKLSESSVDLLVVVGDITGQGMPNAASFFADRLKTINIPKLVVMGNTDIRSPEHFPTIKRLLETESILPCNGFLAIGLNTERAVIQPHERVMMNDVSASQQVLLFLHHDLDSLETESRKWIECWMASHSVSLMVSGHTHRDSQRYIGNADVRTIRGLDPDKASGGPPAISYFNFDGQSWEKTEDTFLAGTVCDWNKHDKEEFIGRLGISCFDPVSGIDFAVKNTIRFIELRPEAVSLSLKEPLRRWREMGQTCLSVHLPELLWNKTMKKVDGVSVCEATIKWAMTLGAQMFTIHVPNVAVGLMEEGSAAWREFSDAYFTLFNTVSNCVEIHIENMHMTSSESNDDHRRFGYLPDECLRWIREVNTRIGVDCASLLLDIGHARNNAPFSESYPLSAWYTTTGQSIGALHVHQVVQSKDGLLNHQSFDEVYGSLISLSGLIWSWKYGLIRHAPMFLEIRDVQKSYQSFQKLRNYINTDSYE